MKIIETIKTIKKTRMQNLVKCFVLGIGMISILGITGCSQKDPEDYTLKEINSDLPNWFMQPRDAMGKNFLCEVGSDSTRTGAILEGKENLMQLIETEVKVKAQTRRNSEESSWRTFTEFRSEGILKKASISKYQFGPDGNLYILMCINKNDLPWENW